MIKYSYYPPNNNGLAEGGDLYYIEFTTTVNSDRVNWTLFKRQFLEHHACPIWNPTGEVHPWNLGSGRVDPPHIVSMQTEEFLKFTVDALNQYEKNTLL